MTHGATTQNISNPLERLPSSIRESARVDSRPIPSDEHLATLRDKSIRLIDAEPIIRRFFTDQRSDAARGIGEKYRPCEAEARAVPVSVEVPGFIEDNQPRILDAVKALYEPDCSENREDCSPISRGKIAEALYAMAAEASHFRGQNAHRYISCLELAERFDEGIKYRLAAQLASPDRGPEEKAAEIRRTVAVISGVMDGTVSVHPRKNHDESIAHSSSAAGVTHGHADRLRVVQTASPQMTL